MNYIWTGFSCECVSWIIFTVNWILKLGNLTLINNCRWFYPTINCRESNTTKQLLGMDSCKTIAGSSRSLILQNNTSQATQDTTGCFCGLGLYMGLLYISSKNNDIFLQHLKLFKTHSNKYLTNKHPITFFIVFPIYNYQ